MIVIPPNVMIHRASLSRRCALELEIVLNIGMERAQPLAGNAFKVSWYNAGGPAGPYENSHGREPVDSRKSGAQQPR